MKKLVCAVLAAGLLVSGAGAYRAPNVNVTYELPYCDEQINGDPQARAQMLYGLGLFRGTQNGFELDRVLRRDEAAAMLVRFLGGEEQALAGEWSHPFTDVPQWANPYVGWLYENGLTNGVSGDQYGAAQETTTGQYVTFLSRALTGGDAYEQAGILIGDELLNVEVLRGEQIRRSTAVFLSVRALTLPYTADGASGKTLAQELFDQGVYTREQFADAAWDVLSPEYHTENGDIVCTVAGIETARNTDGLLLDENSASRTDQGAVYACRVDGQQAVYFRLDPRTLQAQEMGARTVSGAQFDPNQFLCTMGGRDYLFEPGQALLSCDGTALTEVLTPEHLTAGGFTAQAETAGSPYETEADSIVVTAPDGAYLLTAENPQPVLLQTDGAVEIVLDGTDLNYLPFVVTAPVGGAAGELQCFDLQTGECIDSYSIPAGASWDAYANYLYGSEGVFFVTNEPRRLDEAQEQYEVQLSFRKLTDIPTRDVMTVRWGAGSSEPYLIIGDGADTRIVRLKEDGSFGSALTPASIGLTDVRFAHDFMGYDGQPHIYARNGADAGMYCYMLSDNSVENYFSVMVMDYTADDPAQQAQADERMAAEQMRLNALGVGG